jgi:hypothetical protein
VKVYVKAREATDNNIIRCMRIACWMTKATVTHTEYVILIVSTVILVPQTRLNTTSIFLVSCTVVIRYMAEGGNLVLHVIHAAY